MKKAVLLLSAATVLVLGTVVYVGVASAQVDQVCPGTKVDVEDLPATVDGVIITLVDSDTVHFDIPEGSTVQVCVKAGSGEQGDGPEFFTLTADADLDHSSGKELSHVSVITVVTTSSPPPPPPSSPPPPPPVTTTTTTGSVPPPPPPNVTTTTTTTTSEAPPPPSESTTTEAEVEKKTTSKTKTPNKLAFTGPESIVPIGAIALFLASAGSGLMWLSSKRKRDDEDQ